MIERTITGIDTDLLRVLAALLRTRSATRTAEEMALSQSAISKALARLRLVFDDPLFVRHSRGLIPTPRALALETQLARTLASIDQLIQPEGFDPGTARSTFSIAATDYGSATVLTPLFARLRALAPDMRFIVRHLVRDEVLSALESGRLDFALGGIDRAPEGLRGRVLRRDPFKVIARAGHPAVADAIDLDTFCAIPHAIVATGGADPFHGRVDDALARGGRSRNLVIAVLNFAELPEIICQTDLLALGPESFMKRYVPRIRLFEPPIEVAPLPLAILWHPRMDASPGHRWVRGEIASAANSH